MGLFTKLFGTASEREIKKIKPTVDKILSMENEYAALSEEELKAKTAEFKERLASNETLDDILPEAFAAIREAAWRVLGMKPYPVQLLGGIILHQGRIAEMKTGEGKTLTSVMAVYLNALEGKGHMGTYLGLFNGTICLPQIVAAALGGLILGLLPAASNGASNQPMMMVIAGLFLVTGAVAVFAIKEKA